MKKFTLLILLLFAFNSGYGQTTLIKEDIAIIGVNTDAEDFTVLLRTDITIGTTIYFTDNEVNASGTGLNDENEGMVLFTAGKDYSCGEIIGFLANGSEFTTIDNTFMLNNGGDQVLAFQGFNSGTLEWTTFLHANVDPGITLPVGFTAADIVDANRDNNAFIRTSNTPTWTELNDITNYAIGNNFYGVTLDTSSYNCSCRYSTTWNGAWWTAGLPNSNTEAIISANYNTSIVSFKACSLTVNPTFTLTVNNGTFVEVENDVIVDGELIVETQGNFVQNNNSSAFTVNTGGLARVIKQTPFKAKWYYYTYWSSPVVGETIEGVFPDVDGDRRFWFNAANFIDAGGDIDDNGDDWQYAFGGDTMTPGVGYAATESRLFDAGPGGPGGAGTAAFEGAFNTGNIDVSITSHPANTGTHWNFIGNPYPSAINFDLFHAANSAVVEGAAYFWSHATPPSAGNSGNQQINFSGDDYAMYNVGTGPIAGASGIEPTKFIPSGQGFFIEGIDDNTATFTNAMRMADGISNSQFFKSSSSKKKTNTFENRLWVNITSDNGAFNQILVGYVDGATDNYDGSSYDAKRLLTPNFPATLYSTIENSDKKFAIQGKAINSLIEDEVINLGFATNINVTTLYKLSIAQIEGDFLTSNTVYLKDNLLNTLHDLSTSDYTFTSEVGEFNDRFEIGFNAIALSTEDYEVKSKTLKIIELEDNHVQFTASMVIRNVKIFDLLGRQLYNFKGQNNSETYKLSKLSSSIYIAKVELSNGAIITKKAFKK